MNEILKRLEIIKSSIAIDDEDIIELQVMKLNKLSLNIEIKNIISKLENHVYSSALFDIENYLKRYSSVVEYIDTEVQSLKLELKSLENKLQTLSEQKIEYLNDIEEFNTLYNLHLGELLKDILTNILEDYQKIFNLVSRNVSVNFKRFIALFLAAVITYADVFLDLGSSMAFIFLAILINVSCTASSASSLL